MSEKASYLRFDDFPLQDPNGGPFRLNVVDSGNCQVTYISQGEGAGHGFHQHDDMDEVLIFLEGHCTFGLGDAEFDIRGGAAIHAPRGVPHKVKYLAQSKVIRIKYPSPPRAL